MSQRIIRFRAFDKYRKEWVILNLEELSRLDNTFFDYENWCESTGLTDSKGREIWEGDIVLLKQSGPGLDFNRNPVKDINIEVKYEDGGFFPFNTSCGDNLNADWVEVLGNLYESPELLKEK